MKHPAVEEALTFGCAGEQLIGVLHGADSTADIAVVVIVGGPQYRAGSHRQFVHLGRALAAAGYATLRFDYRGMGDSSGEARDFEHVSDDIAAAIDALMQRLPQVRRVVLWGLCDGASAALLYCDDKRDARVSGVCLLNPWVRSEASLAATQLKHYYTRRLLSREFWAKLAKGGVALGALRELAGKVSVAFARKDAAASATGRTGGGTYQERMARGWQRVGTNVLLILSGEDYTAKEFIEYASADKSWRRLLAQPGTHRHPLADADHTFSAEPARLQVEQLTVEWLASQTAPVPPRFA